MRSRPTDSLHCSMELTNCSSALAASEGKEGLELRPKPKRSKAWTGLDRLSASRFLIQSPTPPPNPWTITSGVLEATESQQRNFISEVHTNINVQQVKLTMHKNHNDVHTCRFRFRSLLIGQTQSPYTILVG